MSIEQAPDPEQVRGKLNQPVTDDHVRDRQGDQRLRAGLGCDPLVRIHSRHAHPGLNVHIPAHLSVPVTVTLGEPACVLDRTQPRFEEVGAERQHILGERKVVARKGVDPKRLAIRPAQGFVGERFIHHASVGAQSTEPIIHEAIERPGLISGEEPNLVARRSLELRRDLLDGIVPCDRRELSVGPAGHWSTDAIGVVEPLKRRLATRAQASLIDGLLRVPFDLHRPPLANPYVQPTTRGTLTARGRVPCCDAGNLIIGRDEIRNELLNAIRRAPGQRSSTTAGDTQHLEKPPAVHSVTGGFSHDRSVQRSVMTRRTVRRDVVLVVTIETPAHLERRVLVDLRHCFYRAMAGLAGDFCLDVSHMREVNEGRQLVYLDPLNRPPLVPRLIQLLDLWIPTADDEMATHTGRYSRHTRTGTHLSGKVAVAAVHLVLPSVYVMSVEDRLLRTWETCGVYVNGRLDRTDGWRHGLLRILCGSRGNNHEEHPRCQYHTERSDHYQAARCHDTPSSSM